MLDNQNTVQQLINEVNLLRNQLDAIANSVDAIERSNALATEIINRTNADNALDDRIDQEISDRTNADNALDDRIDQEISDRTNADNALDDRIDQEISNRTNADNALGNSKANLNGNSLQKFKAANGTDNDDVVNLGQLNQIVASATLYNALGTLTFFLPGNHTISIAPRETIRIILIGGGGGGGGYTVSGTSGQNSTISSSSGLVATALGGLGGYGGYGAESNKYVVPTPARTTPSFNKSMLDIMDVVYLNDDTFLPTSCETFGLGGIANQAFPSNWRRASDGGRAGQIDIRYKNDTNYTVTITIFVGIGGAGGDGGATSGSVGLAAISGLLV